MKEKDTNNNQKDVPITNRLYGNIYICIFVVIFSGMHLSFLENIEEYIEGVYILLKGNGLSFVCKKTHTHTHTTHIYRLIHKQTHVYTHINAYFKI